MSIGNGIVRDLGIKLGNIEAATNYLYREPKLYEPELSKIKEEVFNKKTDLIVTEAKQVSTDINREDIIKQFSLSIEDAMYIEGNSESIETQSIWNTEFNSNKLKVVGKSKEYEDNDEDIDEIIEEYEDDDEDIDEIIVECEDDAGYVEDDDEIKVEYNDYNYYKGGTNNVDEVLVKNKQISDNGTKNEIHKNDNASNTAKVATDLDNLIDSSKVEKINYNELDIKSLYREVKQFMIENGVNSGLVPIEDINRKFGADNVRRLLNKCYIIKVGKGATIGL